MKGRMKKLVALGLAISMSCNGSLLIANAENFSQNVTNVAENQVEQNTVENKNDILISSEKIEIQVEQKAYFYMIPKLENFIDAPVVTVSDSSLAQVSEVALEQVSEEENGKALLENAPSNAKWYEVTANAAGNVSVTVEYEGVQKEIQIQIYGTEIDENAEENIVEIPQTDAENASTSISNEDGAEENTAHENETILSQRISDGWSQDGLYYYIDGVPVKGIAEIKGVLYYFDAGTGRLCKKAQWIEQDGKRYFCNAEGILYRNQFIKFGTIYYYMGNDGSMQTGIVKVNDGRLYYMGEDGTVQKKAQWIEQDGKRYFCNAEGVLYRNQFIKFGTIYYYMGSDGSMQTGIVKANDGRLYYIGEDGTVQKKAQWIEQDGKRYFCNAEGILYQNRFIKFGDTYYYCGNDAAIVKGTTQAVNGVLYRFDSNGIMIKEGGWGEYKGNKYYKNPATGFPYKNQWVTFGRIWYYANANGFMVSGWQTIGGKRYYFYYDTKYMARNAVIEGIRIGDDGVADPVYTYAAKVLDQVGWNLKAAFDWSASLQYKNVSNNASPGSAWFATYGFQSGRGDCYVMAATFYYMAKVMGYNAHQIDGYVPRIGGGKTPHSWVEIDMNGTTYVYDPDFTHEHGRNGFQITYGTSGTWRYMDWYRMN